MKCIIDISIQIEFLFYCCSSDPPYGYIVYLLDKELMHLGVSETERNG